jgi:FeS assembly SUF system regulator
MIRLSKLTDYAVVILSDMASHNQGQLVTASIISARTHLPEPTVSKVLKLLAKGHIILSTRGAGGGYRLDKTTDSISIADVITVLEGPLALTACADGKDGTCAHEKNCAVKGKWNPVNIAMRQALEKVTLTQMISGGMML